MARSLALLAGALATVAAQTTTVEFVLPLLDPQPLDGSVIAVKGGATTLAIHCPAPKAEDCGFTGTSTVVGGPSTVQYTYTMHPDVDGFEGGEVEQEMGCILDPKKDMATCSIHEVAVLSGITEVTSTTASVSGYKSLLMPITVTAGVNKLNGNDNASATEAAGSEATSADKPKDTGAKATGTADATASSDAAATPVKSDNAAGPMVTQNAILAAAAVVGGAAMLL
ncbi:HFBs protein [Fusarium austroafricanum]|uniref:HFBs protein n=1 Tax=Fusarium austroafricanum TaxID=2364996 RepID=A0A8H4KFY5_9HYPO|nr:HFBs protein [Fusarium austroafricanum]